MHVSQYSWIANKMWITNMQPVPIQGFSLGHFQGKWPKDFENDINFEDF